MPTVTMGPGGGSLAGIDLSGLLNNLDTATVTETPTDFSVDVAGLDVSFYGAGFTYDLFGIPTGGLITEFNTTYDGQLVVDIAGFAVSVPAMVGWVLSGDTTDAVNSMLTGADTVTGSAGNDVLGGAGNESIAAGAGDDTVTAVSGVNYLRGGDGNDSIQGGSGFDDINGNKGNDTIDGGSGGGDWLVGGQGDDSIVSHGALDILYGNLGNDTLVGGPGSEVLRGGQGDDSIAGGAGDDWISGDRGNDTLSGGPGADIFHTFSGAGVDRVLDFNAAEGDRVMVDPGTHYTVSQVGADTVIDMGNGDQMILVGVQESALPSGWIFGA